MARKRHEVKVRAGVSTERFAVLQVVAGLVPRAWDSDCVLVGIDGVDGVGKTTFADELSGVLCDLGRPAVRISVDDFHNVQAVRYQRGPYSPEGFWLYGFNYIRLREDVLTPLGPGGSRMYRAAAHDVDTDQDLYPEHRTAPAGSIVIVDGLFLHRDELANLWNFSILLDAPLDVTVARFTQRDGMSADVEDPSVRRYVEAQRLYFAACTPAERANVVIDNTILDHPQLRDRC